MSILERPILFNGPMVRAILSDQKTQTRRVIREQPFDRSWGRHDHRMHCMSGRAGNGDEVDGFFAYSASSGGEWMAKCSFGQSGDRLWVRETWRPETIHSGAMDTCDCDGIDVSYAADGEWIPHTWQNPPPDDWCMPEAAARSNVPSIHMPRWACRLCWRSPPCAWSG
ncbi:hypothetical protein [Stenotrophomonas rhizophila]|uniref:hypothetical protein n=1 Tax=Stenotrophomonas rhizophila TaxID=216778 RepID=UPI0020D10B73|nr:hypothetical protein [Stenotrophomonas rhizophila]